MVTELKALSSWFQRACTRTKYYSEKMKKFIRVSWSYLTDKKHQNQRFCRKRTVALMDIWFLYSTMIIFFCFNNLWCYCKPSFASDSCVHHLKVATYIRWFYLLSRNKYTTKETKFKVNNCSLVVTEKSVNHKTSQQKCKLLNLDTASVHKGSLHKCLNRLAIPIRSKSMIRNTS